jgi:hypothetical protein
MAAALSRGDGRTVMLARFAGSVMVISLAYQLAGFAGMVHNNMHAGFDLRKLIEEDRMPTSTITGRINYEVVWGQDEADRILYVDYGDGTWLSRDAETRAVRKLLELSTAGVDAGLYENGVWTGGAKISPERPPTVHKTRCIEVSIPIAGTGRMAWNGATVEDYGWLAQAFCTCGWSTNADDIASVRRVARSHRETAR